MKKYIEIFILGVIFLIIFYFTINWTIKGIVHSRKEIVVPNIEGKSIQSAIEILSLVGLGIMKESEEFNSQLPPDTVIRQIPSSGMSVREGKIIKVVLSKGSDLVFVPDIKGKILKIAELEIRRRQLKIGKIEQIYSLRFDKDIVVNQNPEPESIVEKNTPVDLAISLGRPPEGIVLMPDFIGKNLKEVNKWAEENNIKFEIVEKEQEASSEEIVIAQEPPPDTILTFDTNITITVPKSSYLPSESEIEKIPTNIFHYEVPQGSKESKIRIILIDSRGEKEIFSGIKTPGSKINIPYTKEGKAKVRIFSNDILIEEREIQ
ncbi:MAG: PASTA domain-containing protein [Endomicrobiia bacterium]